MQPSLVIVILPFAFCNHVIPFKNNGSFFCSSNLVLLSIIPDNARPRNESEVVL
jgi:hypothetical protein